MGVQVKRHQGGQLEMAVSGDFDFETSRQLLLLTKECWHGGRHGSLAINLEGIGSLSSCSVGVLVLLKEFVGSGQFTIRLSRCSAGVHQLFQSGVLNRYFEDDTVAQSIEPVSFASTLPCAVVRA